MSTKRITAIAILSTLSYVGRIAFSFIPNVQPTTAIVIIITLSMGYYDGLLVAILSMLISNLYLGMGVWTIGQIISYVAVCSFVKATQKITNNNFIALTIVSGVCGLLYGFIISLVQIPFFGYLSFIPYYLSGIPFDVLHALGNMVFFVSLYDVLTVIIKRYYKRS